MSFLSEQCRGCPVDTECYVPRQEGQFDTAIVLERWPYAAMKKGNYLEARSDEVTLLKSVAEQVGLDLENAYFCAALNCSPKGKGEALLKNAMKACRKRLLSELKSVGAKKVLCFGNIGFSALVGAEKNLPITKVRGRWEQVYGMEVLPTYSVGFTMSSPDWFRDFTFDLEKFVSTPGRTPTPDVTVFTPDSPQELRRSIKRLQEEYMYVSVDLETTGLSPVSDSVLSVGIGTVEEDGSGETLCIPEKFLDRVTTWRLLSNLLSSKKVEKVFHNAKFDLQFLKKNLEERGLPYDPQFVQDTMLLNYTLDERPFGRYKSHALETIARCRFDAPDYGIDIPKFLKEWATADPERKEAMRVDLHQYLTLDCYYTAMLYPVLLEAAEEEDPDLLDLYENVLLPGAHALADVELKGVKIDLDFYRAANDNLSKKAEIILERIRETTGNPEFNPSSPKQVKDYIYGELDLPFGEKELQAYLTSKSSRAGSIDRRGKKYKDQRKQLKKDVTFTARRGGLREGPTSKAVLKKLAKSVPDHAQVLNDIVEYRNLSKNIGTYVKGMLDRVDIDGRIRGNFNLHGTATGRLSSDNPNLQNIPDSSHTGVEVRNGFIADEGCVLIEADYSQLELRVAAHLSEDPGFKQVFIDGRDVHQEVTWALFRKTKEEASKYERYMAKCMNFGVMYARGPSSLANGPEMEYVEDNGGTPWSEAEVAEFFDKMLKNWPLYNKWMEEQKEAGYRDGYVKGPFGNRRRFDFIPKDDGASVGRQSVNTPIQGTASHITLTALIRIHARLPEGAHIVSTVHDSILIEARRELVNEVLKIVHEEMEENVSLETDVPFVSDADVALRWGEMSKWSWDSKNLKLYDPTEMTLSGEN